MPKRTIHTLTWSSENEAYELVTHAQPSQHFSVGDEHSWLAWLVTHTSFLFQGHAGSLRAYKESRPRGEDYWYAYHFTDQRLRKRYLGRSAALSFARLEEVAGTLQGKSALPARPAQPQAAAALKDSTCAGYLAYPFQKRMLIMAQLVLFFTIYASAEGDSSSQATFIAELFGVAI